MCVEPALIAVRRPRRESWYVRMSHDSSSKRKKRRKKEDASWTFANRSTRESEHQSGVYLNRTLNITFKRGEKIEWVRDSVSVSRVLEPGGFLCCPPASSIDVSTIGRRIVVRDALRHRWSGFIQGERVLLPSVSLSLSFDPFLRRFQSADYTSMWLVVELHSCADSYTYTLFWE